jgi:hypothetical protein
MPHPIRKKALRTCGNRSLTNVKGPAPQQPEGHHARSPAVLEPQALGEVATGSIAVDAAASAESGGATHVGDIIFRVRMDSAFA